jgi:single-strand DNA-binding protein
MAQDNNVTITGNAGREPELRFTPTGQAVANFGVAVSRRWQNRQTNEWEEATSWIDVTCWAQLAENVAESVGRGTRVTVTGRLDQRSWETDNGDKRSKVEIVADDVAISLKWATATAQRNERSDSGSGNYSGGNQTNQNNTQGGRSFGAAGGGQQQPPAYSPEEEPF